MLRFAKAATAVAVAAVALLAPATALSDAADHVYQWRGPSDWVFSDNCGPVPQQINLTGTGSGMLIQHQLADGSSRMFVHYNDHMTGSSSDGTLYRFSRTIERWIEFSPSGDQAGMNAELRFRLISQGAAPNGVLTHRFRFATDANGNVVIDRESYEYTCSGAFADDSD